MAWIAILSKIQKKKKLNLPNHTLICSDSIFLKKLIYNLILYLI